MLSRFFLNKSRRKELDGMMKTYKTNLLSHEKEKFSDLACQIC